MLLLLLGRAAALTRVLRMEPQFQLPAWLLIDSLLDREQRLVYQGFLVHPIGLSLLLNQSLNAMV